MPIGRRLALLLLSALLPALLFVLGAVVRRRGEAEAEARAHAVALLDRAAHDQQMEIDRTADLLRWMSQMPAVRMPGEVRQCTAALEGLLATRPMLNALTSATPAGWITCGAPAFADSSYVGDLPSFRRALVADAPTLGDYQVSRRTGRRVVVVALAMRDARGAPTQVLGASLRLDHLTDLAARRAAGDPIARSFLLFDSTGTVLASAEGGDAAGGRRVADPALLVGLPARGMRVHVAPDGAGEPRLYAVRVLGAGGGAPLYAAVRPRLAEIHAPATAALRRELLTLLASAGAILLFGGWLSRRYVLSPIESLARAARRLTAGERAARVAPEVRRVGGELARLGEAFDEMADALERREREYRSLADSSPDFIVRVGTDERVAFVNRRILKVVGGRPEDWVGRPFLDLPLTADGRRSWREQGMRTLQDGAPRGSLVHSRVAGVPSVLDVRYAPERDDTGALSHVLVVLRDVTEQWRAEERLRRADRVESLGRVTGGLAHDFGNVLAEVLSAAELAQLELPAEHPACADLEAVVEAATRGSALVRQLLSFARRAPMAVEPVAPSEMVAELAPMLQRVLGAHYLLELSLDDAVGRVLMDPGELEQLIVGLAVHAREAMPAGGALSIRTRQTTITASDPRVLEENLAPGDYAVLELQDSARSFRVDALARALEPLPVTRGAALGLATCWAIVRQHGGYVAATTADGGQGVTLTVWLPLAGDDGGEIAAGPTAAAGRHAAARASAEPLPTAG